MVVSIYKHVEDSPHDMTLHSIMLQIFHVLKYHELSVHSLYSVNLFTSVFSLLIRTSCFLCIILTHN